MTKCKKNSDEHIVHDWLFHFNCYTHKWNAFPRTQVKEYFNGTCEEVISDKDYDNCIEKIIDNNV